MRDFGHHAGEIVTELGDDAMAVFDNSRDAGVAACQINTKMREAAERTDRQSPRMGIDMHSGPKSEIGESCEIRADSWYFDFNGYFTEDIPGSVALCR